MSKKAVRMEYIKESAWEHTEKGLSIGEAIKKACEEWNAFVYDAAHEETKSSQQPAEEKDHE